MDSRVRVEAMADYMGTKAAHKMGMKGGIAEMWGTFSAVARLKIAEPDYLNTWYARGFSEVLGPQRTSSWGGALQGQVYGYAFDASVVAGVNSKAEQISRQVYFGGRLGGRRW